MNTALGRMFIAVMGFVSDFFIENLKARTADALRWRRQHGLANMPIAPLGMRIINCGKRDGNNKSIARLEWDENECRQMREIYERWEAGEQFIDIGHDFASRGERRHDGTKWVPVCGKREKRMDLHKLQRAVEIIKTLEADGKRLGDPIAELPPLPKVRRKKKSHRNRADRALTSAHASVGVPSPGHFHWPKTNGSASRS